MGQNAPAATQEPEPVFVDRTGRRRRLVRNAGIAVGCLLAAYLAVVAFGLVSGADAPMAPWPAPKPSHRAALPRHDGMTARPDTPRPAARPTPSATARTRRAQPPRSAATTTRTTAPAATSTTQPGQGRAYGRTKSPNPRKP
ncbi:hypothetical protein Airi01_034640 [Actinoallomurus iriomotensis]|uniref:Uncharacterized protein n=1 Tax=Actinoallomurus iriomotensis TaxID=478107 RepID=A0A9W6RJJ2_9ACTN|nr:hypothetical protein Airi01_034640 [Actinoallomurus iriomotensis]